MAIGDINTKSRNWFYHSKTSYEGEAIEKSACQIGLHQVIKEPSIDVIFTSQPNLMIKSGIHSSLHSNYHHQVVYRKFNLEILYSPSCMREV